MADNQACVYAAMLLNDAGVAISADKINAVATAAGFELRPTVPILFANFLAKKNLSTLIANAATSGASGAAAPVAAAAAAAPAAADNKKAAPAAKKKATPPPSDEDDDMIGGLF